MSKKKPPPCRKCHGHGKVYPIKTGIGRPVAKRIVGCSRCRGTGVEP